MTGGSWYTYLCQECGIEFCRNYKHLQKYCSHECAGKASRIHPDIKTRSLMYAQSERARDLNYSRLYGITWSGYCDMLTAQGSGCAICGKIYTGEGKRFAVDHDHTTQAVRAILCESCNRAIGLLQEDTTIIRKCADYLDRHRELGPDNLGEV